MASGTGNGTGHFGSSAGRLTNLTTVSLESNRKRSPSIQMRRRVRRRAVVKIVLDSLAGNGEVNDAGVERHVNVSNAPYVYRIAKPRRF